MSPWLIHTRVASLLAKPWNRSLSSSMTSSRRTVFAPVGARRLAAESHVDETHAVADAEKRHRQLQIARRETFGRVVLVNARRSAGKDDSFGLERVNFFQRDVERMDLAVNLGLADAAGDQLGVLRTEIENENHSTL